MLTNEQSALLTNGAKLLHVELTKDHIAQIAIYLEELKRWAKIADLVSQSDPEVIIRKHILDSLTALAALPERGRLLDLGSGAGFPGLPLAITNPSLAVTLLEPRRKRVNFLKEVIRKANLTNTHAYEGRAEELERTSGWKSAFDAVITRATWNLREFLTIAAPFVSADGILVAMKGAKAKEELQSLSTEPAKIEFILRTERGYQLPYGKEERTIFTFTKKSST